MNSHLAIRENGGGLVATGIVHVRPGAPICRGVENACLLGVAAPSHHDVATGQHRDARAEHVVVCNCNFKPRDVAGCGVEEGRLCLRLFAS
jgi:hypothetical protein